MSHHSMFRALSVWFAVFNGLQCCKSIRFFSQQHGTSTTRQARRVGTTNISQRAGNNLIAKPQIIKRITIGIVLPASHNFIDSEKAACDWHLHKRRCEHTMNYNTTGCTSWMPRTINGTEGQVISANLAGEAVDTTRGVDDRDTPHNHSIWLPEA